MYSPLQPISQHHRLRDIEPTSALDKRELITLGCPNPKPRRLSFRQRQMSTLKSAMSKPRLKDNSARSLWIDLLMSAGHVLLYITISVLIPGSPQAIQGRALAAITFWIASTAMIISHTHGVLPLHYCLSVNMISGIEASFAHIFIYSNKPNR
uniref:Uncharacterized protein n=1 Tax=Spongospora subterranea TaxID=70186 RepID=A0A0H5RLM0_9EUKA|eukprot:CRZ09629.1 hypothetical protein [Spongospora subterranea]